MNAACIGQPLSWLTLERHALAELDGTAASAASAHLGDCAACRAALGAITGDRRALPPLPALPDIAPAAPPWWRSRRAQLAVGLMAAAAILLVVLVRKPDDQAPRYSVRVKGAGVVVMTLVRERDGAVTFDPPDVLDTDRWKIQLTCAPGGAATVEVTVMQPRQPPVLALTAQRFACGNNVVIPGAFHITGGDAIICARFPSDAARPQICATVRR